MEAITHHIEKYIIKTLTLVPSARFAMMREPKTDSNLYSYHLTKLLKQNFVTKTGKDYSLSPKGLQYVDRMSMQNSRLTFQSKICTLIILKNEEGEVLLSKRLKQPLLGQWGLPTGKLYIGELVHDGARRELQEKTGVVVDHLHHLGDLYHSIYQDDFLISSAFIHVFAHEVKASQVELSEHVRWADKRELSGPEVIKGVDKIVQKAEGVWHRRGERFFDELRYYD